MLLAILAVSAATAWQPKELVSGNLRIQLLTPNLVRIEQKGPEGFENRETFTVVNRPSRFRELTGNSIQLEADTLKVPEDGKAEDVVIVDSAGHTVYKWDGKPVPHSFLPGPQDPFRAYVISDNPRMVPPAWGATPPPAGNTMDPATSGWDVSNDAPDIYVFLNGAEGYEGLRKDFLDLTGHTPMAPLAAFGFWDSRYYEYKQQEALDTIDKYRSEGFPLDFFVVDTDWRVNGSHGYDVSPTDFPDMPQFIKDAHARHVHLMYNDHPEPVSKSALAPEELQYRWLGLDKLLGWGADVWWYDRNWSTRLVEPAPGISPEVWGDRIYHDMTLKARPTERPMIMSNIEGIDNGIRDYAPHPAMHRYPIWWTGDTTSEWNYLIYGIKNGVDSGVISLCPYVNEDLGGHIGKPTAELYVRYLEYGSLSPITRVHCTKGGDRHPWVFGPEAEAIVRDYIKLRYRLLPTLYSAAHRTYEDGTPILRRCDLEWPQFPEASDNTQYLLGDDLLVAPTIESVVPQGEIIPARMLHTSDGKQGLLGEFYGNTNLAGQPVLTRVDKKIDFNWHAGSPAPGIPKENFSIRWSGKLGPVPETGEYSLAVRMDDGCRLFLNGKKIIDDWTPNAEKTDSVQVSLEKGQTYDLRLEYLQLGYDDSCHLEWMVPQPPREFAARTLWIPPGEWENAWTGEILAGPQTATMEVPLNETPIFCRRQGIVLTGPDEDYAAQKPWTDLIADVFTADEKGSTIRTLYEDDGHSNAYLENAYRTTQLELQETKNSETVTIRPSSGDFVGEPQSRAWLLRIHLWPGQKLDKVQIDGRPVGDSGFSILEPALTKLPMLFTGKGARPAAKSDSIVEIPIPKTGAKIGHVVILSVT